MQTISARFHWSLRSHAIWLLFFVALFAFPLLRHLHWFLPTIDADSLGDFKNPSQVPDKLWELDGKAVRVVGNVWIPPSMNPNAKNFEIVPWHSAANGRNTIFAVFHGDYLGDVPAMNRENDTRVVTGILHLHTEFVGFGAITRRWQMYATSIAAYTDPSITPPWAIGVHVAAGIGFCAVLILMLKERISKALRRKE